MNTAQFDAWTRRQADLPRRRLLRLLGGSLLGAALTSTLEIGPAGAEGTDEKHVCCALNCADGFTQCGCFTKIPGGCPPPPDGCTVDIQIPVDHCGKCLTTICPSRKPSQT